MRARPFHLLSLAFLGGTAACTHSCHSPDAGPTSTSASDAAIIDAAPLALLRDAGAAHDAGHAARIPTPEERKAYTAALAEGRHDQTARSYDAAIAAFTRALVAIPDNARALAERGYAHFLKKEYDAAQVDLARAGASCDPHDRKLAAQIEFNLGLVCQAFASGDDDPLLRIAAGHFRRSNDLSPSRAAAAKMIGCPLTFGVPDVDVFASLTEAEAKLAHPTGEDDDYTSLDVQMDAGPLAHASVRGADSDSDHTDILLPLDRGRYARVLVGSMGNWMCGTMGETTATRAGDVWTVVYQEHHGHMGCSGCYCGDEACFNGEGYPNTWDPPCKCDEPVCPMTCGPGTTDEEGPHEEMYIDARTGKGLWSWEVEHDYLADVKPDADLAAKRFTAKGLDCAVDVSMDAARGDAGP